MQNSIPLKCLFHLQNTCNIFSGLRVNCPLFCFAKGFAYMPNSITLICLFCLQYNIFSGFHVTFFFIFCKRLFAYMPNLIPLKCFHPKRSSSERCLNERNCSLLLHMRLFKNVKVIGKKYLSS